MQSLYSNEKFTRAQTDAELTEHVLIEASQEHLVQVLNETLENVIMIINDASSNNRDFLIESIIRQAMWEAIRTREATIQYNKRLEMR